MAWPRPRTDGRQLLASGKFGCTEEILSIAAMLSVPNVFVVGRDRTLSDKLKKKFAVHEGDHITLLNGMTITPLSLCPDLS